MKLDVMKRQAGRPSQKNSGQNDQNFGKISRDVLAEEVGESSKQIQRYICLTELIPELLDMVDAKKLNFTIAVDISYIEKEIQKWIYEYIRDGECRLSVFGEGKYSGFEYQERCWNEYG